MSNVLNRKQIAWRIAHEIKDGSYVNLGIGMPEMVARQASKWDGDHDLS